MYTPFERQGSIVLATHAKLDKVIIEENDVTIQFVEGYLDEDGNFKSLGADHINMAPAQYAGYDDAKEALLAQVIVKGQEVV